MESKGTQWTVSYWGFHTEREQDNVLLTTAAHLENEQLRMRTLPPSGRDRLLPFLFFTAQEPHTPPHHFLSAWQWLAYTFQPRHKLRREIVVTYAV